MSKSRHILDLHEEFLMDERLVQQAEQVKGNINRPDQLSVGLESELFLVNSDSRNPVSRTTRNKVLEDGNGRLDTEIGHSQVEIGTEPVKGEEDLLNNLESQLRSEYENLIQASKANGVEVLRAGSNPFLDLENMRTTEAEKYEKVPEAYKQLRIRNGDHSPDTLGRNSTIDTDNTLLPTTIASSQLNYQVNNLDEGINLMNHIYQLGGFIYAMGGNSRLIDGKDTGLNDLRVPAWSRSHDIRDDEDIRENKSPDVGQIDEYWQNWDDYIDRIRQQPRILTDEELRDHALDVGVGMYWKDARLKVEEDDEGGYDAILEARQTPQQPSVEEEMAVNSYVLGRILYKKENEEDLMDIQEANRNRNTGIYAGLGFEPEILEEDFKKSKMYDTEGNLRWIDDVLTEEISKAEEGLEEYGMDTEYLDPLRERVDRLENPSLRTKSIMEGREMNKENLHEAVTSNQVK